MGRHIFLIIATFTCCLCGYVFLSSYFVLANDDDNAQNVQKNNIALPFAETDNLSLQENIFKQQLDIYKIDVQEIDTNVRTLSSIEFKGREVGKEGGRKAGEYIANYFRSINLLPGGSAGSYFQTFHLFDETKNYGEMTLLSKNTKVKQLRCGEGYIPFSKIDKGFSGPYVLVGYGISSEMLQFDEYANIDVEDKIVIVFSGAPWDYKSNHWFKRIPEIKELDTLNYKVKNAEKHGAKAVFVLENPIGWRNAIDKKEILKTPSKEFLMESNIPVLYITKETLVKMTSINMEKIQLFAGTISKECVPSSISFDDLTVHVSPFEFPAGGWVGRNVIGVLPGSDQELKKEAIIIGAHYDHLGENYKGLNLGANDNASGVSALLSIAKAFTLSPNIPKRTIIFIAFDAEEIGKIGSASYVDKPIIPLENTVMMINFDMIGRNEENRVIAVASLSSNELHAIHQEENRMIGLELEHPENMRLGRSDHTAFYYAGIPVIYFFGGKHEGYHSPDDTWDKISMTKIMKVARLAFLTANNVANRPERIVFNKEVKKE